MPDVTLRIEGDERVMRILNNPTFINGPMQEFLLEAGFIIEANQKLAAPVDTGRLRSSITTNQEPRRVLVGPTVQYAPHVEHGSAPHWPPRGALQPWAQRHGFPAGALGDFLVRRLISRRGTRPHPFVGPSVGRSLPAIRLALEVMLQKIRLQWSRRAI